MDSNYREILISFGRLGLTSFGGPAAHLGYFRDEFVKRRQWLGDEAYADLVTLCHVLPGPASSQIVFALGLRRKGLAGAILASICFTLPSALIMIAAGYGMVALQGGVDHAGWLRGLKVAAVAVVAQAVWSMGKTLCPDLTRKVLALAAAALTLLIVGKQGQLATMLFGALAGFLFCRTQGNGRIPVPTSSRQHVIAISCIGLYVALLILLPLWAGQSRWQPVQIFSEIYRAGALVFGGGHVVLPLLKEGLVPKGWISSQELLAGYGVTQALPGPLFTFAAYLGTAMNGGAYGWKGGVMCLIAIFLPGLLLVGGALPFGEKLRAMSHMQSALRGTSAAVVGILLAALYNPLWSEGITSPSAFLLALVAFLLLSVRNSPPWLVVLFCVSGGAVFLGS